MDPITPSDQIIEITLDYSSPGIAPELITSIQRVPLPLFTRALFATEISLDSTGGGSPPDCDDGRPDSGMLYPRG